jgi:hypothetical protein
MLRNFIKFHQLFWIMLMKRVIRRERSTLLRLHRLCHESVWLLTGSKKKTEIKASLRILKNAVFIYFTHIFFVLNSKAQHLSPYAELKLSFWHISSGSGGTRRITRVALLLVLCVRWMIYDDLWRNAVTDVSK